MHLPRGRSQPSQPRSRQRMHFCQGSAVNQLPALEQLHGKASIASWPWFCGGPIIRPTLSSECSCSFRKAAKLRRRVSCSDRLRARDSLVVTSVRSQAGRSGEIRRGVRGSEPRGEVVQVAARGRKQPAQVGRGVDVAVVAPQRGGHPGLTQPRRVRLPLVPQRVAARGEDQRWRQAGQACQRPSRTSRLAPAQPATVTRSPIARWLKATWAVGMGSSTQPRLCGHPYEPRTNPCTASPPLK